MPEKPEWKKSLEKQMKPIKWLNWRGRRSVFTRGKEIKEILEGLNRYELGVKEDRDLAREEFRGAVQRYVIGLYEDSIFRSCFSVEMGLLIRISEKLTEDEKKTLHAKINRKEKPLSFTFGVIILKAEGLHILEGATLQLAKKILKTRNIHIHAHNFISALIGMRTKGAFRLEDVTKSSSIEESLFKKPFIRLLPPDWEDKLQALRELSNFEWCAKEKSESQLKKT